MKRGSYARGIESREALEWAAIRVVAAHGVDGVSVEAVAKEAGLTKGSAYWHFPTKDALLDAAAARALEAWMTEMLSPVLGIPSAQARIQAVLSAHAEHVRAPKSPAVFLAKVIATGRQGAPWSARWRARVSELIGPAANRTGAADALYSVILGMTFQWDATGDAAALRAAGLVAGTAISLYLTEQQEHRETYGTVLF